MVAQTLTSKLHRILRTKVRQDIRALTYSLRQSLQKVRTALTGHQSVSNPHLDSLGESLRVHQPLPRTLLDVAAPKSVELPKDRATRIFAQTGVYPVSFSYPRKPLGISGDKKKFLSHTIPGEPYSFDDERAYLQEYQDSYFALSTKKSGWDCFRHLEILMSGSIPLIPHLRKTSPGTMFAYPKALLADVLEALEAGGPALPTPELQQSIYSYAVEHLTSAAMARYMLDMVNYQGGKVAFLDSRLESWTDYQSVFSLIGLKSVLGENLHTSPLPHYLTSATDERPGLYGKGFGYRGAMAGMAGVGHDHLVLNAELDLDGYEVVFIGQFFADFPLVKALPGARLDLSRTVGIVGDDYPESPGTLRRMANSPVTFFVRELAVR